MKTFLKGIRLLLILPMLLMGVHGIAQADVANPTANLMTAPSGSLVIAMDNVLQAKPSGDFNLKSYGLIVSLLNANKKLRWVIKTGKAKDAIDFTATAEKLYPTPEASSSRNFIGGPFVIFPQDTAGTAAIINAFNASMTGVNRVKVYRLTQAQTVDVRYTLFNPIKVGILDEGGAYNVHEGYMESASIPMASYEAANRFTLNNSCYTFVSEPHNDHGGLWIDSVRRYLTRGGNFLAECAAIITYEEWPTGKFQTTGGYDNVNTDINGEVVFPQPDLSYIQVHGLIEPKQGGNTQTYKLNPGSTTQNDWSAVTKGSTSNPDVYGASVSDMKPNDLGGLVFYLGNHEYKDDEEEGINGIRMYFNAMLTPSSHELCPGNGPPPDLSPNITAIPNIMHGMTQFNVTVKVSELLSNATDGSQILIRIPKDPRVTFAYNNGLTMVGFTPVNNSIWTYDGSDPIFHRFTTNAIIPGNGFSTFGFVATFTPGQSQGKYTLSSSLNSGSGGEIITNNNQDAEVIDYFIN